MSRRLNVALIGAGAGVFGVIAEATLTNVPAAPVIAPAIGGAAGATLVNILRSDANQFRGFAMVALFGAMAGVVGSFTAKRLAAAAETEGEESDYGRLVFFGLTGSILGGAASAMSFESIAPPEFRLLEM